MPYTVEPRDSDIVVDNTILKSVAVCHTQAALQHVLGLTTSEDAKQLLAGQYAHETLAWWLCKRPIEEALGRLKPYKEWCEGKVPEDDPLAYRNVRKIMRSWLKQHPLETWQLIVKPEEVEVPLSAVLLPKEGKRGRVVMVALLDALAKRRTGGRYSVDHKTTRNVNEYFTDEQEDSAQFSGQLWLAAQHDVRLAGIFINAIEFWKVPSSSRRCTQHGTTYEECGLQHLKHKLFCITRTPHEIKTWEVTARGLVQEFLQLREQVKTVEDVRKLPMQGRFTRACRNCSFRDFCRMGRPLGSAKSFLHRPWDPLAHAAQHVAAVEEARAAG